MIYNDFCGKTFLITGATGVIGINLVDFLLKKKAKVVCSARSKNKASKMNYYHDVDWLFMDMTDQYSYSGNIDYIIHAASPTDSNYFITNPVDTINSTIIGMNNILKFALEKKVKGFLFTSSMEVYGICTLDKFLKEDEYYSLDCTNIRSSYAEGKKILECLCVSYGNQYNLPVKIVRLAQTFGNGVSLDDNRVFAQFARSVINGEDIILSTKGETKRSYCSTEDAVDGILNVLLYGDKCTAYNIASDNSYCSIYDMALKFTKGTKSKVIIKEKKDNKYLPTVKFGLDTSKAKSIGFKSADNIDSIIEKFLVYYRELLLK